MAMYQRGEAADYLTERSGVRFTTEGLAARDTKGTGPSFSIFNGRAVYSTEALDEWLDGHLANASPSAKGRREASFRRAAYPNAA